MGIGGYVRLGHRAVVTLEGEDRVSFLQGLISVDVFKLAPDRGQFAAMLTPQGKFLFDLILVESDGQIWIDTEADRAADLARKLGLYKLRAKLTITPRPDLAVFALPEAGAAPALGLAATPGAAVAWGGGVALVDPRLAALGVRLILPAAGAEAALAAAAATPAAFEAWERLRLSLGIPDGARDLPVERALLLENGYDELGGVDFAKGCYMGQELTARTKHRGLIRKRLMPVRIDGPTPAPGTPVLAGAAEAGEMCSAAGDLGLAMIRLEHFAQAQAGGLTCGAARLTAHRPDWAVFPEVE